MPEGRRGGASRPFLKSSCRTGPHRKLTQGDSKEHTMQLDVDMRRFTDDEGSQLARNSQFRRPGTRALASTKRSWSGCR